jgi:hypothetical protein
VTNIAPRRVQLPEAPQLFDCVRFRRRIRSQANGEEYRASGPKSLTKGAFMRQVIRPPLLALALAFMVAPHVQAAAPIEFIDTGTPSDGTLTMTGWRGIIVRLSLDDRMPITRINLGGFPPGEPGYIRGSMAQRWTDPIGQGNYTESSPGPFPANNSFNSSLNFDSHLLGTPEMYVIQNVTEGKGYGVPRTGLPSDGSVGYLATLPEPSYDPFILAAGGHLGGLLDVRPAFQSDTLDIA